MAAPLRLKVLQPFLRKTYFTWKRDLHRTCCCWRSPETNSSQNCNQPYYITTPIFYVNAAPHIGHLYTALLADVAARWQRLKGRSVIFCTGTDEHGLKIQQAAEKHGANPSEYCDRVSSQFRALFDQCEIAYDDFIRTTEPRHYEAVQRFWETLQKRGHIYKGSYEGWYCISDEAFLTEDEVQDVTSPDGQSSKVAIASGQPVIWTKEENYMFRLTAFQEQLSAWLSTGAVKPAQFEALVRSWLDDLRDLSVSRQRQRLTWGIPVPGDDSQTIYVWLDALINYLTLAGYPLFTTPPAWPPTCQIIGKDILRFHAVYWPAFLFAADMAPPTTVLVHSHWLVNGHKMSKSRGNVVDPLDRLQKFTVEGLRYFLLKEGSLSSDGNYSDSRMVERINSDIVNSLGNLLSRTTAPSVNKQQEFPSLPHDVDWQQFLSETDIEIYHNLQTLPAQVDELYESFSFSRVIDLLMVHVHWANSVVQAHQPWSLVKSRDDSSQQHLRIVLHVAMETLRVCGILLQPMMPQLTDRLLTRLGVSANKRHISDVSMNSISDSKCALGEKVTLLNRIQTNR